MEESIVLGDGLTAVRIGGREFRADLTGWARWYAEGHQGAGGWGYIDAVREKFRADHDFELNADQAEAFLAAVLRAREEKKSERFGWLTSPSSTESTPSG